VGEGRLLEWNRYVGHYYGTPAFSVNRAAESGLPVLLVIDVNGALELKKRWPGVTLIFLEPPSEEELAERLRGRGDETEKKVQSRLHRAREEMALRERYDWSVVNDEVEEAADRIAEIIGRQARRRP
jgi:guanylate kinase